MLLVIFLFTIASTVLAKDDNVLRKAYLEDRMEIASDEHKQLQVEYNLAKLDRDAAQAIMDAKSEQMESLEELNTSRRSELRSMGF